MTKAPTRPETDALLRRAEAVLEAGSGERVRLSEAEVLKDGLRALTLRCRAAPSLGSVIVKAFRYESDRAGTLQTEAERGFSEWASLEYLADSPARRLVPRWYGGVRSSVHSDVHSSDAAGLIVLEDLGPGRTLEAILEHGNRAEAEEALLALARTTAQLHGATQGGSARFEALRRALPGALASGRRAEAKHWLGRTSALEAWRTALGCTRSPSLPSLEPCLTRVAATYAKPGPWLAFSHGDPAPSNTHVAGRELRLVDFEFGAFRHALYDLSAWEILCPLPMTIVNAMRAAFREELALTLPVARNPAAFDEAWALLCVYRALALLSWLGPDLLNTNRPWARHWTGREAVLVVLSRLRGASAHSQLEPVHALAEDLLGALQARWPEYPSEPLPRWATLGRD